VSSLEIAIVVAVVTAAACLQGSIGFGMALVAAPILVLIEPAFVPGPLIASGFVLVSCIALRDRSHVDFATVRFSMMGNFVGAFAGASVVAVLDPRGFAILFGLLVLLGVTLSAIGLHVRVTRKSALGAGLLGGFMSATSSIGGPPMALVYQHHGADRFRATLSAYFVFSTIVSVTALTLAGVFGSRELRLTALLVPGQLLGFALSYPMTRVLSGWPIRPFILGLSAVAAMALLGRVAFG
jgi:uncharacterized membrane protein YfcA